jgi:MFS family permease
MAAEGDDGVPYRRLLADPALVSVFCISAVGALGTNAIPVALPSIGGTFGLNEPEIGLIMSAFSLSVLLALPVISIAADVYGRRVVVIPSLLLLGTAGLATLGVRSYPLLLALRALQGVAFAGTLPLTTTLTGDLYTGAAGSAAQGIRSGLNGLASAAAPVAAGALTVIAWQYPFVLFGLAFPAAAVVYLFYPEPVDNDVEAGGAALIAELRSYARSIYAAADGTLLVLISGGLALFFVKAGFRTFVPVLVVEGLQAGPAAAGTILGVYGGTRVLVSPLSGSILVRLGRKGSMLVSVAVAAVGVAAIPFAPDLLWLGVAAAVYAAGEAVLNPVVNDAVAAFAADDQRAGIMSGLQMLKNVGLTLAPALLGAIIAATDFETAFLVAAAVVAGYGLVVVARFDPAAETFT